MFFGLPLQPEDMFSVVIYCFSALLVTCVLLSILYTDREQHFQKLAGGLAVFIVALLSHNAWVIWTSLFIGGLIIASEKFMKSLAAILRSASDKVPDTLTALYEDELKELEGQDAIDESASPSPAPDELEEAEQATSIQLMEPTTGNFLTIAFEIEKLLRTAASLLAESEAPKKEYISPKLLKEKGLLTDVGVKKVEAVRWLRNMLTHGRSEEVDQETLATGVQVAYDFWQELNNWLNPERAS